MSTSITRTRLEAVVSDAASAALREAALNGVTPGKAIAGGRRLAAEVVADPRIAPALRPVSRLESQTIRGIVVATGAPLLVTLARMLGLEVAEGDAAVVCSTLLSLAGAAYAWYGRETTTRPLA